MKRSAIRMAYMRERRRRGFRCYLIEVRHSNIAALVARGFLDRLRRDDPDAIERAIGAVLDRM
jgi:hypothetical protein